SAPRAARRPAPDTQYDQFARLDPHQRRTSMAPLLVFASARPAPSASAAPIRTAASRRSERITVTSSPRGRVTLPLLVFPLMSPANPDARSIVMRPFDVCATTEPAPGAWFTSI